MRKTLFIFIVGCSTLLFADGLKNSLSNMLNEEESNPLVNFDQRTPVQKKLKKHRSKSVVATVNKHKILKREADKHLKARTQGQISNYDLLPLAQRKKLIEEMSIPLLAKDRAKKELSLVEKKAIYSQLWMQKKVQKIKITEKEIVDFYAILKEEAKKRNQLDKLPLFTAIKDRLKMQLIEKKIVEKIMENVKIKIF